LTVVATSGIAVFDLIEKSNPVTTATKAPKEPPPPTGRGERSFLNANEEGHSYLTLPTNAAPRRRTKRFLQTAREGTETAATTGDKQEQT
jgi:hypothetical protein